MCVLDSHMVKDGEQFEFQGQGPHMPDVQELLSGYLSELMLFSNVGCCPLIGHGLRVKNPVSTEVGIQPISSFSTFISTDGYF